MRMAAGVRRGAASPRRCSDLTECCSMCLWDSTLTPGERAGAALRVGDDGPVPGCRDRRDDVPLLVRHFLEKAAEDRGLPVESISEAALEALAAHPWPGNIRELQNTVERLAILASGGEITADHLPEELRGSPSPSQTPATTLPEDGLSLTDAVDDLERDLIQQALERTAWNKNRAAQLLGMNRTTLLEKIKKRGLVQPDPA